MRLLPLLGVLLLGACTATPPAVLSSPALDRPAMVIRDVHGKTFDFANRHLRGTPGTTPPDQRRGTCLLIENSTGVTIRNLAASGYKVAILARSSPGLTIADCDLSQNYRPHLKSTPEREDESDWLSYHRNESNEWLRYGAAIYLDHCPYPTITRNTVTGCQNALLMTNCDRGLIHSNDFSYNSGLGIGMYRSSFNAVMHNRLDFNVRGHSEGVYNRGQDSAAILVFEQCCNNLFAFNSATHSGDGFFLWAGQTTMDTGRGGCNDNVVYCNDFSCAPTNGVEVTFSRNYVANNRIVGCDNGIWAGYSYGSIFSDNEIASNRTGIAIEHGQDNAIADNLFRDDAIPVHLWARPATDASWGYPKHRDTASHGYRIEGNFFSTSLPQSRGTSPLHVEQTTDVATKLNSSRGYDETRSLPRAMDMRGRDSRSYVRRPPVIRDALDAFNPLAHLGRSAIRMTGWGPYDGTFARLSPVPGKPNTFDLLGPDGEWTLLAAENCQARLDGTTMTTTPKPGGGGAPKVTLRYVCPLMTRTEWGEDVAAGAVQTLTWTDPRIPLAWDVSFFRWSASDDIRTNPAAFAKAIAASPLAQLKTPDLRLTRVPPAPSIPLDHYITIAETPLDLPPGQYVLHVTSDDGFRAILDGQPLRNEWHYQAPTSYDVPFTLEGTTPHTLRIEHFQIDGYATLQATVTRK